MYSIEAEQAVIGRILSKPELIHETILTEDHFYSKPHQIIFKTMLELRDKQMHIDPVTLVSSMGDVLQEIGGFTYLMSLNSNTATTGDVKWYEQIVRDKYTFRNGTREIQQLIDEGVRNPTQFAHQIMGIAEKMEVRNDKEGLHHVANGLMQHYDLLNEKKYNPKETGFRTIGRDLDKVTGKWQKQTLNIIAARPSVGKTAFMLGNARVSAEDGATVAVFSLEQPETQLFDRWLSAECNIDGDRMRTGQLYDDEWMKYSMGLSVFSELDIYIDERQGLTIGEIRSEVRRLKKKNPNLIVYIDYLQLIKGGRKFNSRNEEVGYVSTALKEMARENDCPVVALAQLSRDVEKRQDKRPMMSDLRESGNIEQDADTISFLYRDDYYNKESEKKNVIEIIVAKNREGGIGTAEMVMLKQYCKFVDFDRNH